MADMEAASTPELPEPVRSRIAAEAIEHRLSGGSHYHHRDCIHNLPPEEQVALRGRTVEWWLAVIGPLPQQISPDDWAGEQQ